MAALWWGPLARLSSGLVDKLCSEERLCALYKNLGRALLRQGKQDSCVTYWHINEKKLSVFAFWAGLFRKMVSWYKVCLDEQQMSQQGYRWFLVTPKCSCGSSCKVKVFGHNVLEGRLSPFIYFRGSLNSLNYCILCRFMQWRWALQGLSAQTDGERMGFSSWLLLNFFSIISQLCSCLQSQFLRTDFVFLLEEWSESMLRTAIPNHPGLIFKKLRQHPPYVSLSLFVQGTVKHKSLRLSLTLCSYL